MKVKVCIIKCELFLKIRYMKGAVKWNICPPVPYMRIRDLHQYLEKMLPFSRIVSPIAAFNIRYQIMNLTHLIPLLHQQVNTSSEKTKSYVQYHLYCIANIISSIIVSYLILTIVSYRKVFLCDVICDPTEDKLYDQYHLLIPLQYDTMFFC